MVEPCVSYLRRKVDQDEPRLIHTIRGLAMSCGFRPRETWRGPADRALADASLRIRVMAIAAILVALTSLVTGFLGTALLRSYLYDRADTQLRDFGVVASRVLERSHPPVRQSAQQQTLPTQFLVEVVSADGQVQRAGTRCIMPTPRGCRPRSSATRGARSPRRQQARRRIPGGSWWSRSPAAGTPSSHSASIISTAPSPAWR